MSELEEKLGKLLSDPSAMQQLMGMAKMLSGPSSEQKQAPQQVPVPPEMGKMLSALGGSQGIDADQQQLLTALQPYLSRNRVTKLERAMGAAKMARAASAFLNAGGLRSICGR